MRRNNEGWGIRSVQLDLARQMETLQFIGEFIDFIAANGYNSLTLYLEGRIRTDSFPYPSKNESYSPDQIRRIVDLASARELDVIPVVSTLGHAEKFLCHKELESLAELRGGREGRFGNQLGMFCPSLDETFVFLETYLTEIAELFPSKYFHAGCDESWDIGYCPVCRDRIEFDGQTQSSIFSEHLRRSRRIITEKLGKRMIVWDDMFEMYPEALDEIPKDIVMCSWHYGTIADIPVGHFLNQVREDSFAKYDAKGFDYMVAPADYSARNVETFTRYASRYRPIGGLLTTWEKSCKFLYGSYPTIAFAGRLWRDGDTGKAEDIYSESIKAVLDVRDEKLVEAVKNLKRLPSILETGFSVRALSRGLELDSEREKDCLVGAISSSIRSHSGSVKGGLGKKVIEDILAELDQAQVNRQLRILVPELIQPMGKMCRPTAARLRKVLIEMERIHNSRLKQWKEHRKGLVPRELKARYSRMKEDFALLTQNDSKRSVLSLAFFLPDQYSAQKTSFSIRWRGQKKMTFAADGVFKEPGHSAAFYRYDIPIVGRGIPEVIRIETWGYGGQGFSYLEIRTVHGRFVPVAILNVEGSVEHPEHILVRDLKWCFAGERNTRKAFLNPGSERTRHVIEISMGNSEAQG
ncbi:MAG: family 20 glycosylhydrolase [Victivallales bacterium]|nr:family 20 glycosylhydrolase [Victivallales bacterium]